MFKRITSAILPTKTVGSIMSTFTKQIAQLRALEEQMNIQSDVHANKAKALRDKAFQEDENCWNANFEAIQANRMASKIEAFLE